MNKFLISFMILFSLGCKTTSPSQKKSLLPNAENPQQRKTEEEKRAIITQHVEKIKKSIDEYQTARAHESNTQDKNSIPDISNQILNGIKETPSEDMTQYMMSSEFDDDLKGYENKVKEKVPEEIKPVNEKTPEEVKNGEISSPEESIDKTSPPKKDQSTGASANQNTDVAHQDQSAEALASSTAASADQNTDVASKDQSSESSKDENTDKNKGKKKGEGEKVESQDPLAGLLGNILPPALVLSGVGAIRVVQFGLGVKLLGKSATLGTKILAGSLAGLSIASMLLMFPPVTSQLSKDEQYKYGWWVAVGLSGLLAYESIMLSKYGITLVNDPQKVKILYDSFEHFFSHISSTLAAKFKIMESKLPGTSKRLQIKSSLESEIKATTLLEEKAALPAAEKVLIPPKAESISSEDLKLLERRGKLIGGAIFGVSTALAGYAIYHIYEKVNEVPQNSLNLASDPSDNSLIKLFENLNTHVRAIQEIKSQ